MEIKAEEAIEKIKTIKTNIFGQSVQKYNYGNEIRSQLELMAMQGTLNPSQYYKALKLVWNSPCMLASIKDAEYNEFEN